MTDKESIETIISESQACGDTGSRSENLVSRRAFVGMTGTSVLAAGSTLFEAETALAGEKIADYPLMNAENQIYSVCLQCNTGCGIKAKIVKGTVVKIDGNPYNPFCLAPNLPMTTSLQDAARIDAPLCPKGQAGIQSHYDPYRITRVLKRAGKRGENKWQSIDFNKAISEIVEGGTLFSHVPGEENRNVEGMRSLYALQDPKLYKAMSDDIKLLHKKKLTIDEFKSKYAAHLDKLIDPNHPDFGPKNNQFVYLWGRKKDGRGHFAKRFVKSFGSSNAHGHTTVCQGSLYFSGKAMSEQWVEEEKEGKIEGKFDKGDKFYFQIDTERAKFVLFVGANLFEANYGPTNRSPRVAERIANGDLTIAVVDPRFSKLASKAERFFPVKVGGDGALAMALARWIFEQNKFDRLFLSACNKAGAKEVGEPSWTNAAWLVRYKESGEPGAFVRAKDFLEEVAKAGIKIPTKMMGDSQKPLFVAWQGDSFVFFDPNDEHQAVVADVFVDDSKYFSPEHKGIKIGDMILNTSLGIFRNSSYALSIDEYSEICGIKSDDITWLATQLTSYGKQAGIDIHRGVSQHTNGFYNSVAFFAVNALIGNYGWAGGSSKASTFKIDGSGKGHTYDLAGGEKDLPSVFGISFLRHMKYEDSTIFEGYPAKRNWWPHATDIYQDVIPSMGEQYPYPAKILMTYMAAPTYSLPGGHKNIEILRDVEKLPLYFASDITIGETSMYADYIFPDLSYLERWEFQGSHPNMTSKLQGIRQPVADFGNVRVEVFGEQMPCSFEAMMLGLAEQLRLPAFGPGALGKGSDFKRPEDYYLKMVANIATEEPTVPDATAEEIEIFLKARSHLKVEVFSEARWSSCVSKELWPKVIYLLNRGGRYTDYDKIYKENQLSGAYNKLLNLYFEKIAGIKNSFTGKNYAGYPKWLPIQDTLGKPVVGSSDYPLKLITNRVISMTKSRTVSNYWLLALTPENHILINPVDGKKYGLADGSIARVVSSSNPEGVYELAANWKKPMEGKVKYDNTIMPGVITFTLGHGHWAAGATDYVIDGKIIKSDKRRSTGIHANGAMQLDEHLKNTPLIDPIGGSVAFYDSFVGLKKV